MRILLTVILLAQMSAAVEVPRRSLLTGGLFGWLGLRNSHVVPSSVPSGMADVQRLREAQLLAQGLGTPVQTWIFEDLTTTDVVAQWMRRNPSVAAMHREDLAIVKEYCLSDTSTFTSKSWSDMHDAVGRMSATMGQYVPEAKPRSMEEIFVHRRFAKEFAEDFAQLETNLAVKRGVDVGDIASALRLTLNPKVVIEKYLFDADTFETPGRLDLYDDAFVKDTIEQLAEFAPEYANQTLHRGRFVRDEARKLMLRDLNVYRANEYSFLLSTPSGELELMANAERMYERLASIAELVGTKLKRAQVSREHVERLGPSTLRTQLLQVVDDVSRELTNELRDLPQAVQRMRAADRWRVSTGSVADDPVVPDAIEWTRLLSSVLPNVGVSLEQYALSAQLSAEQVCSLALASMREGEESSLPLEHQTQPVLMPLESNVSIDRDHVIIEASKHDGR